MQFDYLRVYLSPQARIDQERAAPKDSKPADHDRDEPVLRFIPIDPGTILHGLTTMTTYFA
jgi:hypothetical protein